MSIYVMSRVFKTSMGGANRKALAVRLADFADDEGRGIYPGVERLAAETELSERTVQRILADFESEGILICRQRATGRPGMANRYDFDLDKLFSGTGTKGAGDKTGDSVSPVADGETGDNGAERGDSHDIEGCHSDTRTVIEPPLEPSPEREGASEHAQDENPAIVDRAFKRWFPTWPSYLDDSEPKARAAWRKLSADDRQKAAELTKAYVEAAKTTGRKYTCSARVYLSERRWEKLAEPPKVAAATAAVGGRIAVPVFGPLWALGAFLPLMGKPTRVDLPADHRERVKAAFEALNARSPQSARRYLHGKGVDLGDDGNLYFPEHFERDELRRLRMTEGYPETRRLYEAKDRGHATVDARYEAMKGLMEAVPIDSETYEAWRAFYAGRFIPFPPISERMPVAFFPKGGPAAIDIFLTAVQAADNQATRKSDDAA